MKREFVAFLIAISASFCNTQHSSNGNEEMNVESSGGYFIHSAVNQSSSTAMNNSLNNPVSVSQQTSNQLNTGSSTLILEPAPVSVREETSFQLQSSSQPTISVTEYNSVNELAVELGIEISSFINQEMQNRPNTQSENVALSTCNSHAPSEMQPQLNNESGSSLQPNGIQTSRKICAFTLTLQQYNLFWNTFPYPQHTSHIFTEHLSNKYSFLCQCIKYSSKLKSLLKTMPTPTVASKFWNSLIPYPSMFPYLKQLKINRIVHQSIFYIGPTLYPQKSVSRKHVAASAIFSIYQFISTLQSFFSSSGNLIDDFYDLFSGSNEIGFYFAMGNSRLMGKLEKLRKFSHFLKIQAEVAQTFAIWYKEYLKRSSEPITFGTLDFEGFGNSSCNFELKSQLRITSTEGDTIPDDPMASRQMNNTEQSVHIDLTNLQQSLSIDSAKNFYLYNTNNHSEHWWSTCIRVYLDYKDNYILGITKFSAHFSSIYSSIIKFENIRSNFYESFLIILYRFLNSHDSLTRFFHTIYPRYNLLKISSWYSEEILDCIFDLYFKLTRDGYPFLCSSMLDLISNEETDIFVKEILPTFQMETFLTKFQQWCKVRKTAMAVMVEQKIACKQYLEHFQLQKDYFMNFSDGMVKYVKAFWNVEEVWEEEKGRVEEKEEFCSICRDVFTEETPAFYPQHLRLYSESQTYHPIHYECWKMLKESNNFKCPLCRTPLNPVK